ncbi:hypothetical protein FRX31_032968 [Thalictrum thalictroides]|uniref:DUF4283 domain-containing protein n=1 Tax=Thalictrum thalictroides TaxID=46969 RepID=A0A7J6UXZ9_THATH|nr:hypothetical protein FRX31_032968 [Thalictrum thalictroides]
MEGVIKEKPFNEQHESSESGEKELGFPIQEVDVVKNNEGETQPDKENKHVNDGKTWACILGRKAVGRETLKFIPPTVEKGKTVTHIASKQLEHVKEKYADLVTACFVGRRPAYNYMKEVCTKAWKLKAGFTMQIHGECIFTFKFENEEDRSNVLEMASFHVASQLCIIRPWKLFLEDEVKEMKTIPIWVILKQFSLELWDNEGFNMVCSAIGVGLLIS